MTDENLEIGQMVEGEGVYFGTWEPRDQDGKSLGHIFNLYAAPEDVTNSAGKKILLTFDDAVKRVADLENWNGHDGGNFKNEEEVLRSVRDDPDSLKSWFIPTKEILCGRDRREGEVQADNLYKHKDHGVFRKTFTTSIFNGFLGLSFGERYWSCTEDRDNAFYVYDVDFSGDDSRGGNRTKDYRAQSTRPVRAVEIQAPV